MISKSSQYRYNLFTMLFIAGTVLPVIIVVPLLGIGFTLPKITVFSLTAVIATVWLIIREDITALNILRSQRLGQAFLYFVAVLLLSLAWSSMPIVSALGAAPRFTGLLTYAVAFSFCVTALCLSQHPRGIRNIILSIILANTAVVLYGVFQFAGLDPFASVWDQTGLLGRTFSTLGQPNVLAAFLILTVPFVTIVGLKERSANRWIYALIVLLNIIVLLGSASRAGVLGLFVQICLLLFCAFPVIQKSVADVWNSQRLFVAVTVFAILVTGIYSFTSRFGQETSVFRSWGSRQVIWSDTLSMIAERPQGYGLDTMGVVYPKFMSPQLHITESLTATVDKAHSLPLDHLVTLGPLGVVTYYFFVYMLLLTAWRMRQKSGVMFAGFLSITGYSVTQLFGFESPTLLVFFWLIAGLLMGVYWQTTEEAKEAENFLAGRIGVTILCMFCVCASVVHIQWLRSRVTMQEAMWHFTQGEQTESIVHFASASTEFAYDRELLVRFAETTLLQIERTQDPLNRETLHKVLDRILNTLDHLTKQHDGFVPLFLAWQSALNGNKGAVDTYVKQATEKMHNSIDTYRIAAHSYDILGDRKAADDAYRRLIYILPPYWRDRDSEPGRILWKENPWLNNVLTERRVQDYVQWREQQ